ncbi:MAG TPA: hypothetical protein VGN94_10995, partial [Methylobacterium sp.]|nr:hypothetical protein [Methylobacterium sp.]
MAAKTQPASATPQASSGEASSGEASSGEAADGRTAADARARHETLSAEIAEADEAYHGADAPIMTDAAYDALRR